VLQAGLEKRSVSLCKLRLCFGGRTKMGITNKAKGAVVTSVRVAHLFMRLPVRPLARMSDSESLLKRPPAQQKPFRSSSTVTLFGSRIPVPGTKTEALQY
jgi:hypothetical protein